MSDTKECTKCGVVKALTAFSKQAQKKDGLRPHCRACDAIYRKKRLEQHKERDYAVTLKWAQENKGPRNAINAKRRARKLQATPAWADQEAIKAIYAEARRLEDVLGIPMHCDHVVPLQGELVCGLHVETNLQVIPAALNVRKSNKFKVQ